MRRFIPLLLCLTILLQFTGCGAPKLDDPGTFYYYRTETTYDSHDGVIAPEQRELGSIRDDVGAMLDAYLSGPVSPELESPFPRNAQLRYWYLEDRTLKLVFSSDLATLNGVELTIACGCIARTFLELLDIDQVEITASGALVGGETAIILTKERMWLADNGVELLRPTYTVYYTDAERRYLIGEKIELDLTEQEELIPQLIQKMKIIPTDSGLSSALPPGTMLLDATVEDGLCTLNLSAAFETYSWSSYESQRLVLMAMVNTLTQLDEVERVEFCIEGNLLAQYRLVTIPQALEWDDTVIGPVRTGVNEFDATLYLDDGNGQYLVPVPTRIRQTSGISQTELVVEALTGFVARNGLSSPVPAGTELVSYEIRDGICYLDLSAGFLETSDHLPLSVRSIAASVCELEEIASVVITVNGVVPEGEIGRYFGHMTPDSDWFV